MRKPRIRWADDTREQMLKHEGVTAAVTDLAESIAREAASFAPQDSGDYVGGIVVVEVVGPDGVPSRSVKATDPKSLYIEFGTGQRENSRGANRGAMPAYHPLTRAAEALGLMIGKTP